MFRVTKNICIIYICQTIFLIAVINVLCGQSTFIITPPNQFDQLYKISSLNKCAGSCQSDFVCNLPTNGTQEVSLDVNGFLYDVSNSDPNTLFRIDTLNCDYIPYFDLSTFPTTPNSYFTGLVCTSPGIFYSIWYDLFDVDTLYKFDVVNNQVINVGPIPYDYNFTDLVLMNDECFYVEGPSNNFKIVNLDLDNPSNSQVVFTNDDHIVFNAIGASNKCNTLLAFEWGTGVVYEINYIENFYTTICNSGVSYPFASTSMLEFATPDCSLKIDLDCDDSSGAINADFNCENYQCLSSGVAISDIDNYIQSDNYIDQMTIEIVGYMPDGASEILDITSVSPLIDISGQGTGLLTLTNMSTASSREFMQALNYVIYQNLSSSITAGLRTIQVQFNSFSGLESNIAIAFINVIELPIINVDLGPDQEVCEGVSVSFNAGHPGAQFVWSTGEETQAITADETNEYIVTVTDGVNCPGSDTVALSVLPVIEVELTGDAEICDNIPAELVIVTNASFPLTVDISADPGSQFSFSDVTGSYPFSDVLSESTVFTITSVTPSQNACISVTEGEHFIEVYPSYQQSFEDSLCDGDSIWLGYNWETEAGVYVNTFNTIFGCDSVVSFTITVLPSVNIFLQTTTCDIGAAGVFVQYLDNPNGCDTVIQNTVLYLPTDTTIVSLTTCNSDSSGTTTQILTNHNGCDSIIVINILVTPPQDTTMLFQITCDSSQLGIYQVIETSQSGCDSLIIVTVSMSPVDTTYLFDVSCDEAQIGIWPSLLSNIDGCDSLVILTVIQGQPDTTYFFSTSCDSSSLGVFERYFTTAQLCDSLVISTVTYSMSDSTWITETSCDSTVVGVSVYSFVNRFGCDSIVTETVTLLPADAMTIASSTCDPESAGVFVRTLINQYGCDSIVTEIVTLLPSDTVFLNSSTCITSDAGQFINIYSNQYGCDSVEVLTVSLLITDTTFLSHWTCTPESVGVIQHVFLGADGCDSLVIDETKLFPLPQLELILTSDYNGYGISCYGMHDGVMLAHAEGAGPFDYLWSTGDTIQTLSTLGAGLYAVSITDKNGCEESDTLMLDEPGEFEIGFEVTQPDCFSNEEGSITVMQNGGIQPVYYSIDGNHFQPSPTFNSLLAGNYTITARDANGCEVKEIILINVSVDVQVDLGEDRLIFPGDTSLIEALVNVPFDSLINIQWTGLDNPACANCLIQFVAPIVTTAYTIMVSDIHGCSDSDSLTLYTQHDADIFIPNVFSPNGDGINDRLVISGGSHVEEIESFSIFDRWGNIVFLREHFLPNDPSQAWDGYWKNQNVNPGVFAYQMHARFSNGSSLVKYGDVTVIK